MKAILTGLAMLATTGATAQEATQFGQWRVACQPSAGCALAVSGPNDTSLGITQSENGDVLMVVSPQSKIQPGSVVSVTLAGFAGAELGPGDGWHEIDIGPRYSAQIAPSIAANELVPRMRRAASVELAYIAATGTPRSLTFSLDGFADARDYASAYGDGR